MKFLVFAMLVLGSFSVFAQPPSDTLHAPKDKKAHDEAVVKMRSDFDNSMGKFSNLADALPGKDTIKKIDLSFKQLTELPNELFEFTKLEILDISHNKLTTLPAGITKLKNLKELYIGSNNITNIDVLFKLRKIRIFRSDENKINAISPKIRKWKKLKELVFSGSSELPKNLWKLRKLETLRLWDGTLTQLPPQIGKLKKLKTLCIRGNSVSELPVQVFTLKKLDYLSLTNNKFTTPPAGAETLPVLTYLSIAQNPINDFSLDLNKMGKLEILACFGTGLNDTFWQDLAKKYPKVVIGYDISKVH
jgi:internalin A